MDAILYDKTVWTSNDVIVAPIYDKSGMDSKDVKQEFARLRKRTGLSVQKFAELLGYKGGSSIQTYEPSGAYSQQYLPFKLIDRLLDSAVGLGEPPITREDIVRLSPVSGVDIRRDVVPVVGTVCAGQWAEIDDIEEAAARILGGAYPDLPTPQFAYRVEGESLNRRAIPGQYVICNRYEDIGQEPQNGHIVIVERERHGLVERTAKVLKIGDNGKIELWPNSSDERHKKPLILDEATDTITIPSRVREVVSDRF